MNARRRTARRLWRRAAARSYPVRAARPAGISGRAEILFTLPEGLTAGSTVVRAHQLQPQRSRSLSFPNSRSKHAGSRRRAGPHDRAGVRRSGGGGARRAADLVRAQEPLFILYATLFSLQALYIAYFSGQGFDWPWLSYAHAAGFFRVECAGGLERRRRLLVHARDRGPASVSRRACMPSSAGSRLAFVLITCRERSPNLSGLGRWSTLSAIVMFLVADRVHHRRVPFLPGAAEIAPPVGS